MPKPITKKQLADFWLANFLSNGLCGLCGNSGTVNTTGRAVSAAGVHSGGKFFCLCPNGRALHRASQQAS